MSAMIILVSLPMSRLSLFGQQSPAAPYWKSCAAKEMKCALTDVGNVASQTLILKQIHSKDRIEAGFVFDGIVHNDVVRCS